MKKLMISLYAVLAASLVWGKTPDVLPPLPEGAFTFAVVPDTQA